MPAVLVTALTVTQNSLFSSPAVVVRSPVYILPTGHGGMARLSWPGWLIKYWDSANETRTREWSPIPVLTRPDCVKTVKPPPRCRRGRNIYLPYYYVCESDKHKYAVTCEIGQQKCRTDVVRDLSDNPVFNQEFHLYVVTLTLQTVFSHCLAKRTLWCLLAITKHKSIPALHSVEFSFIWFLLFVFVVVVMCWRLQFL